MDEPFDFDEASGSKSKKKSTTKFKWWWIPAIAVGGYGGYYLYEKFKADAGATTATATPAEDSGDGDAGDVPGGGGTVPATSTDPTVPATGATSSYDQTDFIQSAVAAITAANPKISAEEANNVVADILNGEPVPYADSDAATAFANYLNSGGYSDADLAGLSIGSITVAARGGSTKTTDPSHGGSTGGTSSGSSTSTSSGISAGEAATKSLSTETTPPKTATATDKAKAKVKKAVTKAKTAIAPQDKSAKALDAAVAKDEFTSAGENEKTKITTPDNVAPGVNAGADIIPKAKSQVKSAAKVNPLNFTAISDNADKKAPVVVKKAAVPAPKKVTVAPKPTTKKA
jgi:hypothetical protein